MRVCTISRAERAEEVTEYILLPLTPEVVEAGYRECEDGERRWRDLEIAAFLGYEKVHNIRSLIRNHREELNKCGSFLRVAEKSPKRRMGRPGVEYWLNFDQASLLCMWSGAERAQDIQRLMLLAWRKFAPGEVAMAPRMELRQMGGGDPATG